MRAGHARADVNPRAVAPGLWAIIDGLLRAWLISPESFCLDAIGGQVADGAPLLVLNIAPKD